MTYTIIGYRLHLTAAARGMLYGLIGAEIADGLLSPEICRMGSFSSTTVSRFCAKRTGRGLFRLKAENT